MNTVITEADLYAEVTKILPNAIFDTDSSGEIIIATGYTFDENGNFKKITND
jgi:hypothetical protein